LLAAHGLIGSMSRRGNPYDNAKAVGFIDSGVIVARDFAGTVGKTP
jgi:hypothetical protein